VNLRVFGGNGTRDGLWGNVKMEGSGVFGGWNRVLGGFNYGIRIIQKKQKTRCSTLMARKELVITIVAKT